MRVKIYYRNLKPLFGGVIGKTSKNKLVVAIDGNDHDKVDMYRNLNEVVVILEGRVRKTARQIYTT